MRTILAAKESIAQLWGHPKPKDTAYRLMKYLLRVEVEDGVLLHNCVTGHLVLLTNEEAGILKNLPAKPTEPMQELIANHFLVPEDFDEYRSVKQLRKICQTQQTGDAINHYVILPTTFCNARCFYCYESDFPRVHMTEETASKVVDFIDEHRIDKDVSINWFGGEPLVGMARIDQISQGLKDRGIDFSASMISNGYLLDEAIVKKCVDLWNLKRIQITLDGTETVYNKVKAYANAQDNPFQRVLRNIDLLSAYKIHVSIRINVGFYNKDDIHTLIEELGERYSGNKHVSVYLNMLFNHQGYEPVHLSQEDMVELLCIIDDFTLRLKELKLGFDRKKLPSLQFSQCMADNSHVIEIQPDGSFCRCEHEAISESYGNLADGVLDPEKPLLWKESFERSDYCPECSVYPACFLLRRCLSADVPCIESFRLRSLKAHKEVLRSVYQKRIEGEKNEEVSGSGS